MKLPTEQKQILKEILVANKARSYKLVNSYRCDDDMIEMFGVSTIFDNNIIEIVYMSPDKKRKLIVRGDGTAYKKQIC